MSHRSVFELPRTVGMFLLALAAFLTLGSRAQAQTLGFDVGIASTFAGDPSGQAGTSSTPEQDGSILAQDLILTRQVLQLPTDANGDLFVIDPGTQLLWVIAGSNKPIPVLPGISIQAGHAYTVAGGASSVCAVATDDIGDGCPAIQSFLNTSGPSMAIDSHGNLFFVDYDPQANTPLTRVIFAGGTGNTIPGLTGTLQAGHIYSVTTQTGAIAVDAQENIYFSYADVNGNNVFSVLYSGTPQAGNPLGIPASTPVGTLYTISAGFGGSSGCTVGTPLGQLCNGTPFAQANLPNALTAIDPSGNFYFGLQAIYVAGSLPGILPGVTPGVAALVPGSVYTIAGYEGSNNLPVSNVLGVPATSSRTAVAALANFIAFDNAGSLYFPASSNGSFGNTPDRFSAVMKIDPAGLLTTVFGGVPNLDSNGGLSYPVCPNAITSADHPDPFGDGCPATSAALSSPKGIAIDPDGNLYVLDVQNYDPGDGSGRKRDGLLRRSTIARSALVFSATAGIPLSGAGVVVNNLGSQPLAFSGLTVAPPFSQVPTGGASDCSSATSLAPGESCRMALALQPTAAGPLSGAVTIASNSTNAPGGTNVVAISGTLSLASTTTTLTASPAYPTVVNPSQPVTFTVSVAPQFGDTLALTGTVKLMNGSTQVGSAATVINGVATISASLPSGSQQITAVYSGDSNFSTSTSLYVPVQVSAASTVVPVVTLTSSSTTAAAGQSVTLTATVASQSGTPITSGTIVLQDGLTLFGTAVPLDGTGTAVFTASLPIGANTLLALFNGAGGFGANTSNAISVTVTGGAQLAFTPGLVSVVAGVYPPFADGAYGSANEGYSGDGGPASQATFITTGYPTGLAGDAAGNIYVADTGNNVVRVIAGADGSIAGIGAVTKGSIYTFAGSAKVSSGAATVSCPNAGQGCNDGGQATAAGLYRPTAVTTDGVGNVYIADGGGQTVRKVNSKGVIQTIAGSLTGSFGFSCDGGPATQAQFGATAIAVDNAGNLYIADGPSVNANQGGGGITNNLIRRVDSATGIITTVAGVSSTAGQSNPSNQQGLNLCLVSPCGDGGPATSAYLANPTGVALDTAGNLYIADFGDQVIRKVDAKTGIITTVAGIEAPNQNPSPAGDGGPATDAQLAGVMSLAIDSGNNLYIGSQSSGDDGSQHMNIRMVNAQTGIINTLVGTLTVGTDASGNATCTPGPCGDGGPATEAQFLQLTSFNLDSHGNLYWLDGLDLLRSASVSSTGFNFGAATLGMAMAEPFTASNIGAQPLTFTGLSAATTMPANAPSPSEFAQQATGGSDCTATTSLGPGSSCNLGVQWFPTSVGAETGTISVTSNANNAVAGVNAITLTGTGQGLGGHAAQTITFPVLNTSYVYRSAINLGATTDASEGGVPLSVVYRVIGPATLSGSILTATGIGTVTVTAYQFGDSQFAPAGAQSQTFTVTPAPLTVAASDESILIGMAVTQPAFTISGIIAPDTQAAIVTGAPVFTITDPATGATIPIGSSPADGRYNINIAPGTLSAGADYTLAFSTTPATLSVTGSQSQVLSLSPLPNVTYGAAPITLSATSTNSVTNAPTGLPIKYVLDPASASVATIAGNLLKVTGAGAISVTATQGGDPNYAAATSNVVSFTAAPAPLTVTATNVTVAQGTPLPDVSKDFSFSGFVNGDTQAAVTGSPVVALTAANTQTLGTSAIDISLGSLSSANYGFTTFVKGTLSVVAGTTQTITFPPLPNTIYGGAPVALGASVNSPLGVAYTVSGPARLSGSGTVTVTGVGTVSVTATQPGAGTYQPATPVVQMFTVAPAVLTLTANNLTRPNDTQNPPLTYTITGFVDNDTQASSTSGSPILTTTATPASPVGTYPIIPVADKNITAANYTFMPVDGTLTVTAGGPVAGFSLTATPQQLNLLSGETGITVISVTPINFYQGMVTLSCGKLPANVVCNFSPATASIDASGAAQTITLAVTTNSASPVVSSLKPASHDSVVSSAFLYLPASLTGLFLLLNRRRFRKNTDVRHLLLAFVSLAGIAGLVACGSSTANSSASKVAAPGTYAVTLTATGQDGVTTTLPVSIQIR